MEIEEGKKYIIWENLGYEGWSPTSFKTEEELLTHIQNGHIYGEIVITEQLGMKLVKFAE